MPTADCSRQHEASGDSSSPQSPSKTGGAQHESPVTQNPLTGGSENIPVTQDTNQPDYADKTLNGHQSGEDLERISPSPEGKSSPTKSADIQEKGRSGDGNVNGQTADNWVHDQGDQESGKRTSSVSPTVYTVRNDAEIVNISSTDQTSRVGEQAEESEGETETETGSESGSEEEEEEEEEEIEGKYSKMDTEGSGGVNGDSGVVLNQDGGQSESDAHHVTGSPDQKRSQSKSPEQKASKKRTGSSQETADLQRAASVVRDMNDNIHDLFGRVRTILGIYHTELSAKTLNEFVLEKDNFQDNFKAISNIYNECENVTSSINKQLKDLRQTTTEIYRLINRKFREEDLGTWVDQTEEEREKEQDRLREERIAQEKAVLAKAAEARASFAKASTGVSETHEVVAQVEAEAADAEVTAKKARSVADDAIRIAEEAKKAAEEKRKVEEEARKKAQERAKIRAEEERKKREEEEKRLQEEAEKRGTSIDEERQRYMDEKAAMEAERKNPKNWPRYIYSIEGGDFDPGVGCIIRAIEGSLSRDDVAVKRLDQLTGVLSLYENEELISNIVHVQPVDKEKTFTFEESFCIAIPHCAPRSGIGREPVIKFLQPSGRWIDLPTSDVFFEDIKELRFVEARMKRFGTFAVIYRIKRDSLMFTKRGGKVTSSVDSRVTFISKPLGFKFNTNFTLEVQSVELSLISDLRQRKTECSPLLASSPIIKMGIANKKFPKPVTVTLPVPPNPSRLKRPVTSVNREEPVTKPDNRPATAKPGVAFTKKEEETAIDDLHLMQRLSDGTWVKVTDVTLVQAKNKDIVTFDIQRSLERFFILRTKLDLPNSQVEQIAAIVTESITKRTIQFFLRQHSENLNNIVISCATVNRLERNLVKMEEEGFEEGPGPSKPIFFKEGQIVDLKFRGNLKPETDDYKKQFVFNSHIPCRVDFTIQTIDTFAQKSFDSYRGFAQVYTQGLVPRTLPPADDTRESKRGTQQKAQPRVVMEIGEVLVSELLMTVPKPEPEPPKPLITAPLSNAADGPVDKDVLYHISRELGDEWKRVAQYLNVKRTRIQAILRQNVSKDNTHKIYDMLTTWSKRLPRAVDRVDILSHALMSCGRGDLAAELRERREEFKRQRAVSSRDSYLRKAFVKIARDQTVIVNWKHLGRKLGLSEPEMMEIERDRPTSQDRCYSSLQRWRERNGDEATIKALSQKLRFCRHKALARDIETIA